ncbi:unnamed protein product [Linum trigynum]|uniref:Uncharacterized protein n=1 Tax=Linum trigynum TaxID=586398 RepID=A0AAV2FSP9_9ROSI
MILAITNTTTTIHSSKIYIFLKQVLTSNALCTSLFWVPIVRASKDMMNKNASRAAAAFGGVASRLPRRRGQIKLRIAAAAIHSIVSLLSRTSSSASSAVALHSSSNGNHH